MRDARTCFLSIKHRSFSLGRGAGTEYFAERPKFVLYAYRAELALTKAKLFDRAVIKLDSRALSYGGAVYKVPSRHHGALPSLAALLISNVLFESWLQGHSAILGQRMYTAGNRTSWARNGRYDMLSKRHICFGA
ncbi:MAG TPA: hypothetical protein VMW91_05815 [Desulfosporosinus sp.]|nr:hypothetical protein [Desulfosporosinus sp.]